MQEPRTAAPRRIRVWDMPIRLFHWGLVLALILLWYTGTTDATLFDFPIEWHARAGYVVLGLVAFRWIWSFAGSRYARWGNLLATPAEGLRYALAFLKGNAPRYVGHNPLGGWMVLAMLLSLTLQAVTGLFASDDIFFDGPLATRVSGDTADTLMWLHRSNVNVLLWLVALHVIAVLLHRLQGESLIMAMITGRKTVGAEAVGEMRDEVPSWRAWVISAGVAALIVWLVN
ncbi:cytochrome b/b6 domain-containing protein [Halomonas sp. WWR20]